jgi:hypothetical protein
MTCILSIHFLEDGGFGIIVSTPDRAVGSLGRRDIAAALNEETQCLA